MLEKVYIYIYIDIKRVSSITKRHEGVEGETLPDHPAAYSGEMVFRGEKPL